VGWKRVPVEVAFRRSFHILCVGLAGFARMAAVSVPLDFFVATVATVVAGWDAAEASRASLVDFGSVREDAVGAGPAADVDANGLALVVLVGTVVVGYSEDSVSVTEYVDSLVLLGPDRFVAVLGSADQDGAVEAVAWDAHLAVAGLAGPAEPVGAEAAAAVVYAFQCPVAHAHAPAVAVAVAAVVVVVVAAAAAQVIAPAVAAASILASSVAPVVLIAAVAAVAVVAVVALAGWSSAVADVAEVVVDATVAQVQVPLLFAELVTTASNGGKSQPGHLYHCRYPETDVSPYLSTVRMEWMVLARLVTMVYVEARLSAFGVVPRRFCP
jgi:hypothetical protein